MIIADQIAVESIRIACNYCALCIHDGHYIALKIGDVVIRRAVVFECVRYTASVEEVCGLGGDAVDLPSGNPWNPWIPTGELLELPNA